MKNNNAKIIFHIDMNMFFCSVAVINNPSLKGKAFAIGRENSMKGVISTASYEARKHGIHSAMPLVEAYRLLPSLIVVNPKFEEYRKYHNYFINLIKEYTNIIEVASIDEVYCDMSEISKRRNPIELAKEIQLRLVKEYHLPSSIGIAPTLFLAKMASDIKKPLGITVLRIREIDKILYELPVGDIYGIGKKTEPRLVKKGIEKIKDFMNPDNSEIIIELIGERMYNGLKNALTGHSSNIVDPNRYDESKSISTSNTYDEYLYDIDDMKFELINMAKKLHQYLKTEDYLTKTISITLRDSNFQTITRSKTIEYTDDLYVIEDIIDDLLDENYKEKEYRLLGVGFSNLIKNEDLPLEYNLFTWKSIFEKEDNINEIINDFKKKYGETFITKGVELKDKLE